MSKARVLRLVSFFEMAVRGATSTKETPACAENDSQVCPHYHRAVELIGKRWTGAILYAMSTGAKRFCDLRSGVPGMSDRLLSARLKELEQSGLVSRTVHDSTPVRVDYELTEKGLSLTPIMESISDWASRWHKA